MGRLGEGCGPRGGGGGAPGGGAPRPGGTGRSSEARNIKTMPLQFDKTA